MNKPIGTSREQEKINKLIEDEIMNEESMKRSATKTNEPQHQNGMNHKSNLFYFASMLFSASYFLPKDCDILDLRTLCIKMECVLDFYLGNDERTDLIDSVFNKIKRG